MKFIRILFVSGLLVTILLRSYSQDAPNFSDGPASDRGRIPMKIITLLPAGQENDESILPTTDILGKRTVKIFPNPSCCNLKVDISTLGLKDDVHIELYSLDGVELQNTHVTPGTNLVEMANYPAAEYILRVITADEKVDYKVVKV
jgi:hypothetical protein